MVCASRGASGKEDRHRRFDEETCDRSVAPRASGVEGTFSLGPHKGEGPSEKHGNCSLEGGGRRDRSYGVGDEPVTECDPPQAGQLNDLTLRGHDRMADCTSAPPPTLSKGLDRTSTWQFTEQNLGGGNPAARRS